MNARYKSHAVRPPTWDLLTAQNNHEADRLIESKIQNHEVMSVFHQIEKQKTEADRRRERAQETIESAIQCLNSGFPGSALLELQKVATMLGAQGVNLDHIGDLVQEGLRLELTDVQRDEERGHELRIKDQQIKRWRAGDAL